MNFETYTPQEPLPQTIKHEVARFLEEHLDKYGDELQDILACLDYAMGLDERDGGFVIIASENGQIKGCVVINDTGMAGYIPEHILVYIAVHRDQRGKGLGKKLMDKAIKQATGNIALHVEHDNPAKRLYERIGFTNKYLEMRLIK